MGCICRLRVDDSGQYPNQPLPFAPVRRTFAARPQVLEEVSIQEMLMIGYSQKVFGNIAFEVCHLDMFAHILNCLQGVGEVRITAHQHRYVIQVVPGEMKQVCDQHNVYALFYRYAALSQLGTAQSHL